MTADELYESLKRALSYFNVAWRDKHQVLVQFDKNRIIYSFENETIIHEAQTEDDDAPAC